MAAFMEEDGLASEDLYAVLNVDRNASTDEINTAFRRFSKIFHPDKHLDDKKKKHAENMFNKIKKAHEVLSDPNKRPVYDQFGMKGLEIEGMELISKSKSAAEIIAELAKQEEERKLQQMTNPRGQVVIELNASDLFYNEEYKEYSSGLSGLEVSSMSLVQTVECPLTRRDTVRLGGNVTAQNGNGQGMFTTVWRRVWSAKGWNEFQVSIGNGFRGGLQAFYQINRRCFCVGSVSILAVPNGIKPGLSTVIAWQLDKNLQGKMLFNASMSSSSVKTLLIFEHQPYTAKLSLQLGVQMGIPANFIQAALSRKFTSHDAEVRVAGKLGTIESYIEYGIQKKISQFSWIGAKMMIGVPFGVYVQIRLVRGQQTFVFPVKLSEHIMPNVVFYGTFFPVIVYFAVRKLVVTPYLKEQEEEELEKRKKDHAETFAKQKEEAESAVELMMGTVERIIETEESKSGLIITKAVYGRLLSEGELSEDECINVTIPLQCLVKDSKLQLPESKSKADIPGFYDPCPGVAKSLYIQYRFRDKLHETTVPDEEPIRLPLQSHAISEDSGGV